MYLRTDSQTLPVLTADRHILQSSKQFCTFVCLSFGPSSLCRTSTHLKHWNGNVCLQPVAWTKGVIARWRNWSKCSLIKLKYELLTTFILENAHSHWYMEPNMVSTKMATFWRFFISNHLGPEGSPSHNSLHCQSVLSAEMQRVPMGRCSWPLLKTQHSSPETEILT